MLYYLGIAGVILVFFIVLGIPFAIWEKASKRKKLETAFAGRKPFSDDALYEQFFRGQGISRDVVIKIRQLLAEEFEIDLSRMTPADDFSKNLSFLNEFDSLAHVEVLFRLEEEFGIVITDGEAANLRTLNDIVGLVWTKLQPSPVTPST